MKTVFLTSLVILFSGILSMQGYSQDSKTTGSKNQESSTTQGFIPGKFVDKDNNGICDNYETRGAQGRGRNFVDANGDGVCDNRGAKAYNKGGRGNKKGAGYGRNERCRRGNGCGYGPYRGGR